MSFKEITSGFESALAEERPFYTALIREGLQDPINGVLEMGSQIIHHHLPEMHLVDEAVPTSEGANKLDLLGGAVGKAIDFTILSKLTHERFSPQKEATLSEVFFRGSAYGAIQGGVFTPVHATGRDFWQKRLTNMAEGGLAWGAGSVIGTKVGRFLKPVGEEEESTGAGAKALRFLFPKPRNPVATYSRRFGSLALYGTLRDDMPEAKPAPHVSKFQEVAPLPAVALNSTPAKLPALQLLSIPTATLMKTSALDFTGSSSILARSVPENSHKPKADGQIEHGSKPVVRAGDSGTNSDEHADPSALAKRINSLFAEKGWNRHQTVWVLQNGAGIVLSGKTHNSERLTHMIQAVERTGLVDNIDDRVKKCTPDTI